MTSSPSPPIPITVFTGFLGSGKTTTILSLLPQLPKDYRVVLLKNEFGDVEVDSQLAKNSSLAAVSEILNGCMCCVLVGQMKNALLEIRDQHIPDRIIIETSGSAFPATLAFQIRELERETSGGFKLDAIVTVVDAENFTGYEDQSFTARMQASYTDVILINKWENVSERQLETVMDHLHTLNDLTPKLRCNGRNGVSPSLIFGLDSKLYLSASEEPSIDGDHNDEVQTATIWRGERQQGHNHLHHDHPHSHSHESSEAEMETLAKDAPIQLTQKVLEDALSSLPKESIYRVKGFIRIQESVYILNWAFGRFDLSHIEGSDSAIDIRLTMMGERGETKRWAKRLGEKLGAQVS